MSKPVVVVSQCLGFAAVRYDGQILQNSFVSTLADHVRFVQVCPEVGIGLGVPRDPIRIVVDKSRRQLVQPATGRDLTELMRRFADNFIDGLGRVDGFILKSRSPSCGIKDTKTFTAAGQPASKSSGFFAEVVLQRFPHLPVESEARLTNFRWRHQFLTRLFAGWRLRRLQPRPTNADLVKFHTEYKLQLMAYSQRGLKRLGTIVANRPLLPPNEVYEQYARNLAQVMATPVRPSSNRNVLLHAFGYIRDRLSTRERQYFLQLLEEYRLERLPLRALLVVLKGWALRFEEPYLTQQRFFEPYPQALMEGANSQ